LYFLGIAQYCLKQYDDAANSLQRAHSRDPGLGTWWLAATYAQLGRKKEAANVLTEYIKKRGWSGVPVENTFPYWPFKESEDLIHFADGLVMAGLPRPWNPVYQRQYEEAIAEARNAISLNPNDDYSHFLMAESLIFDGKSTEATKYLERAMMLNPDHPDFYLWYLGLAQFCQGQFRAAVDSFEKYYKDNPWGRPGWGRPVWPLAVAYVYLGRKKEAANVLSEYMKKRRYIEYTVERILKYNFYAFKDAKDKELLAEGLRKAGLK
jgi:tetratricopeptide (TPR) repeat protein